MPGDEPTPAPGFKRLASVVVAAAREAVSPTIAFVLIGLVFTGVLAGVLPYGYFSTTMRHNDWTAPLLMTSFALPAYSAPLEGMMRVGLMFEHGNSVGAAFSLFELGIGLNVGMLVWLAILFGWGRIAAWLGIVTAVTLALAYAIEQPLYFAKEEVNHTHAFDEWSSPFPTGGSLANWQTVRGKLADKIGVLELPSLSGLAFLVLSGLALE